MRIDSPTIRAAFDKHQEEYAARGWNIPYHIDCWQRARRAFDEGSSGDFEGLYDELRRRWQVFRGASGQPWTSAQTYEQLLGLDAGWKNSCLSDLTAADARAVWRILQAMSGVKPTRHGQSVVAISKFLHFWNPRLFVIVDHGVMWAWVFGHSWLWSGIGATRTALEHTLSVERTDTSDATCDLCTYLAILVWAGALLRDNPGIAPTFAEYVARHADGRELPPDLDRYQGAAVEWFLLGLVEVVPKGIVLE